MSDVITHSEMQCADTCLRKHRILYGLKLRRKADAPALRIGSAIHSALDMHAKGMSAEDAIVAVRGQYAAEELDAPDDASLPYEHALVANVLACYFWYWNEAWKVVASEMAFTMPIRNPKTQRPMSRKKYRGKIDSIINLGGLLTIVETKTTSADIDPDSDYFKRLRIDSQIGLYFMAARHLGYDVQQILYNVIKKPVLRPKQIPLTDSDGDVIVLNANGERVFTQQGKPRKTGDTALGYVVQTRTETPEEFGSRIREDIAARPEHYFVRRIIARIDRDVEESQQELWDKAQRLAYHAKQNTWPRNTGACIGFGRCPAFDLCTNSFDPDAGIVPDGWERIDDPHPELLEA